MPKSNIQSKKHRGADWNSPFEEFIDKYTLPLMRILRLAGLNQEDAEDTLLQVFIEYLKNQHIVNPETEAGWLATCARSRAIDALRRRKAYEALINKSKTLVKDSYEDVGTQDVESADYFENLERQLSPEEYQVVWLFHHEGWDFNSIAQSIGKTTGQVKAMHRHAKEILSKILPHPETGEA